MWQGIHGHDVVVDRFRGTLAAGRLASTYLFVGPEGIGKRSLALKLAQGLLCTRIDESSLDACGACESCVLAGAGNHPDLHLVQRKAGAKFLQIDQFIGDRDHRHRVGMCHEISLRPMVGRRRVAIIDDADWLNADSANCLLKLLEEPPPGTVIILIGTSRSRQLPTILSRAQLVRFHPLPTATIHDLALAECLAADASAAVELAERSGGSLARARDLADPVLGQTRDRIMSAWRAGGIDVPRLASEVEALIAAAGKEADARRGRFRQVLALVGDSLLASLHHDPAASAEARRTLAALDRCVEAEEQLDRNANQATLLESWLDDLASLADGARERQRA